MFLGGIKVGVIPNTQGQVQADRGNGMGTGSKHFPMTFVSIDQEGLKGSPCFSPSSLTKFNKGIQSRLPKRWRMGEWIDKDKDVRRISSRDDNVPSRECT